MGARVEHGLRITEGPRKLHSSRSHRTRKWRIWFVNPEINSETVELPTIFRAATFARNSDERPSLPRSSVPWHFTEIKRSIKRNYELDSNWQIRVRTLFATFLSCLRFLLSCSSIVKVSYTKSFVWSVLIRLENSKCNDPLVRTNIVGSLNNTYVSYWFSVNESVLVRVSTSVMETEALTAPYVLDVYHLFLLPRLSFWFCYSAPVLLYLSFCCKLSNKWHNLFALLDGELGSSGKTNREKKVLLVK